MLREPSVGAMRKLQRQRLRLRPELQFVEREEFSTLLISRRTLVRENDGGAGLRGLFEPATGRRFMVEEEKLFAAERVA
jgi:hypothetical protein